jgi:methionine-rich copper-binding protein CopC
MRKVLAPLLSLLLINANIPVALAHSTLVSSNPQSGAILTKVPDRVILTFNENLLLIADKNPNSISVRRSNGISVTSGKPVVAGNSISTALSIKTFSGRIKVTYRVISSDGHPISGQYIFTVK